MSQALFVLYGRSATGKTTLARRLGGDLGVAFLGLDDVKELMYDRGFAGVGIGDAEALNQTCFDMLVVAVRGYLAVGNSLIVDVHEREDVPMLQRIAKECGVQSFPIRLTVSDEVVRLKRRDQRIASGQRHSGHRLKLPDTDKSTQVEAWHTVDTTVFSDEAYQSLHHDVLKVQEEVLR